MTEQVQKAALQRLRRIEGQVRGLQKMVQENRPCADIVTQVSSVEQALAGVAKILLTSHLHHCARSNPTAIDDVVELISKHWR